MTVYIDLDGPILDVSERYFRLHGDLARRMGLPKLRKNVYWDLLRRGAPLEAIIGPVSPEVREVYWKERLSRIESARYLRHDELVPGAVRALQQLNGRQRVVLVTLRKDRFLLMAELSRFGIQDLFEMVLFGPSKGDAVRTKADMISCDPLWDPGRSFVVGDTEADILAGKRLGALTCGIANGIRSRLFLNSLEPDFLLDTVRQLPYLIDALGAGGASGTLAGRPRSCRIPPGGDTRRATGPRGRADRRAMAAHYCRC